MDLKKKTNLFPSYLYILILDMWSVGGRAIGARGGEEDISGCFELRKGGAATWDITWQADIVRRGLWRSFNSIPPYHPPHHHHHHFSHHREADEEEEEEEEEEGVGIPHHRCNRRLILPTFSLYKPPPAGSTSHQFFQVF